MLAVEEPGRPGAGAGPGRRWSMRTHLLGMAGAALALSAVVGGALTARAYSSAEQRAVAGARDAARQVAGASDRDLAQAGMITAARLMLT